jgi:hypothetical protein
MIGRITPTGRVTFFHTPSNPEQITRGNDNYLVFSEFGANKIAKMTTDGVVTESPEIPNSDPTGLTAGSGQSVWFLGFGNTRSIACYLDVNWNTLRTSRLRENATIQAAEASAIPKAFGMETLIFDTSTGRVLASLLPQGQK